MPSPFITVTQHTPPNHKRDIAVSRHYITGVSAPRACACVSDGWYLVIYAVEHGPNGITVQGTEQELLHLYKNITGEMP